MILFSVIIPSYNRAQSIGRALDSLLLQTYKNFEVIICDDGSRDHTEEVVRLYEKLLPLTYIKREKPSGRASLPRNQAVEKAKGQWLCFLDSDDWWYPDKLQNLVPHCSHYDVIYHDLDLFHQNQFHPWKKVKARDLKKPVFLDLMLNHNGLVTSGVAIRKSLFQRAGGFEEIDLEDYDLWLKVSRLSDKFYHLKLSLGAYQEGSDNTTQVSGKEIKRVERIFAKHVHFLPLDEQKKARAAKRYIQGRIWEKMGKKNLAFRAYQFAFFHGSPLIKQKAIMHLSINFIKQK